MSTSINWDKGWVGITAEHRRQWNKAFPSVKVKTELLAMDQWLLSNPRRRKKNYAMFIVNWLKRCQERGGASNYRCQVVHCSGNNPLPRRLTEEEIAIRTAKNEEPGGACDQIAALLAEFKKGGARRESLN